MKKSPVEVKRSNRPPKQLLLVIALGAFVALGATSALFFLPQQQGNPFDTNFRYQYPDSALADSEGRLWVIDQGQRRLTFSGEKGILDWELNSQKHPSIEQPWLIGTEGSGLLIFGNTIINKEEDTAASEEILGVSADGKIGKYFDKRVYDKETRSDSEQRIAYPQVAGGFIYYFFPIEPGNAELTSIEISKGLIQRSKMSLELKEWSAILVDPRENLYLMDKTGNLKVRDSGGTIRLLSANPSSGPLSIRKTENMVWGKGGTIEVLDAKNHCISIRPDGSRTLGALNPTDLRSFQQLLSSSDGTLAAVDEYTGLVLIGTPGQKGKIVTNLQYGIFSMFERLGAWAMACIGALSFITLLFIVYRRFFRQRIPLILKQLVVFIPLIIAAVVFISLLIYGQMFRNLENEVQNRLLFLSQIASRQLSTGTAEKLDPRTQLFETFKTSPEYVGLKEYLSALVNDNSDSWNASTYGYVYRKFDDAWYVFGSDDYVELYVYIKPEFEEVLKSGIAKTLRYDDVYGSWYSGLTPMTNAAGQTYAVCEVTINGILFDQFNREFLTQLLRGVLLTLAVLIVCFSTFTWFLLISLRALQKGASRITEGNYDIEIGIRSHDELQDLGMAFNRMSKQIRSQILHITQLNKANSKFVPIEFLDHLGKKSILEIDLGDHVERTMTVLFSDIRSFTALSEKMSPEENFTFINNYLELMGPVIREHHGFIDKYIGDAIMALYPTDADSALLSALEMIERLQEFNTRHYSRLGTIKLGIGIHTGPLMMGIVGEKERFEGTVISDSVNLSSRLEGLTKQYGVSIIISETTLKALVHPERFEIRFLDLVRVQGKQNPASVYELVSPRDPHRKYKLETRETYKEAFEMYRRQQFAMASEIFRKLLSACPDDKAVESLTRRALRLQAEGASATWDGIIELREK